ncbi:MAG: DUF1801 domain-containing protein [Eubacteriales bacterium]
MKDFQAFVATLPAPEQRARLAGILSAIKERFPALEEEIRWHQPMFTLRGTFILGFSVAKHHLAIAPEAAAIRRFATEIKAAGYTHTDHLFRIKWTDPVNFDLLSRMVAFNIEDKKDMRTFWRANEQLH